MTAQRRYAAACGVPHDASWTVVNLGDMVRWQNAGEPATWTPVARPVAVNDITDGGAVVELMLIATEARAGR